ncbi:hypothetical protein [Stackebrandtia soli]|uniref:hypothetical protein n=1 Tax=Stackebrandtia soli TaxID=1892856 RepID=UPI0039EA858F
MAFFTAVDVFPPFGFARQGVPTTTFTMRGTVRHGVTVPSGGSGKRAVSGVVDARAVNPRRRGRPRSRTISRRGFASTSSPGGVEHSTVQVSPL